MFTWSPPGGWLPSRDVVLSSWQNVYGYASSFRISFSMRLGTEDWIHPTDLDSRPATTPRLITVYCLQLRQVKHPCVGLLQGRNQLALQGSSYAYTVFILL